MKSTFALSRVNPGKLIEVLAAVACRCLRELADRIRQQTQHGRQMALAVRCLGVDLAAFVLKHFRSTLCLRIVAAIYHVMAGKRPKVEPIQNPTLFEMDQLEQARNLANSLNLERPYSEPGLLLGTSAFTANGWPGAFYPPGMKQCDFLSYYAKQFITVEIDSTYYRTPSASTVTNWYERKPPGFIFAAKVPQIITHEKVLKDCEAVFDE